MRLDRLGQLCVRFTVSSVAAFALAGTVALADTVFGWDLLDPPWQTIASFVLVWLAMVTAGSAALAHLLGQLRIADALERRAAGGPVGSSSAGTTP